MLKNIGIKYDLCHILGYDITSIIINSLRIMEDDACGSLTCNGKRCKVKCVEGKVFCHHHDRMCGKIFGDYKMYCGRVWTKRVVKGMTTDELKKILVTIRKCKQLRIEYAIKCCSGLLDQSHLSAIQKMVKKEKMFTTELQKRYLKQRKKLKFTNYTFNM